MSLIPEGQPAETPESEDTSRDDGKPEFLEPQFWDTETGKVRLEAMAKALSDTQTSLRNKEDDIRAKIENELKEGRPDKPEWYKVGELELKLPDGADFSVPEDDKLVSRFREFAYDAGLTNDQFNKAVQLYAETIVEDIPDTAKEMEALGENAKTRIEALVSRANKVLAEDEFESFKRMAMTAKDVMVLEKLMLPSQAGPRDFDYTEPTSITLEAELDKIMASPEYMRGDQHANQRALELSQRLAKAKGRI